MKERPEIRPAAPTLVERTGPRLDGALMAQPLLDVRSISKSFGALRALHDISFTLAAGELLGLAGPNGSGKSTLFNTLTHIPDGPDSGEILLDGQSLRGMRADRIVRRGLVRIFQTETDFAALTVLENVLVSMPRGGGTDGRAMALLERFDLAGQAGRPADEIGVFDRKKLMIATALGCAPGVLLLDEPAAGLSKPEIEAMIGIIRDINGEGTAIIVIEHIMPLLLAVSRRLIVLNFGQVIADGDPAHVVREPEVIHAYLGGKAVHA